MKTQTVRTAFIDYFKARGHKEIPSSPLVPQNDPTTLFISSGMQPLVPYLLGESHPLGKRLVNSQKSVRLQDIDEVGDNRHITFFEMLGNWSLGDYFKKEQLPWCFDFFTAKLGLDPKKLFVTVFEGGDGVPKDTQSIDIWKEIFHSVGIDAKENDRIFAYPAKKNWWSRSGEPPHMPVGEPGGPDSEVFYDFGTPHDPSFGDVCHPNCDCGRFLEIGNSVFMQYQKQADGTLKELPKKNVDFGGGLERLVTAINNSPDIFTIDIFAPLIKSIEEQSGKIYGVDPADTRAMRIMADHMRSSIFMLSDGVIPSNKQQGYVLRRLIRRSLVYSRRLKISSQAQLISDIVEMVGRSYQKVYPEISEKNKDISATLLAESERFTKTLDRGLKEIEKETTMNGTRAFFYYESYGFPWEMTEELAREKGFSVDRKTFEEEFKKHQELSRAGSKQKFAGGLADHSEQVVKLHTATHLLHKSLRDVLGVHVSQKGSNITSERLRFDFSHPTKLTDEELRRVETIVNEKIQQNLPVSFKTMTLGDALKEGALAFFGERYGEKVKVYAIGDYSKEVCGGPHVDSTKRLERFKIMKEEGAGAGVRRIYATVT